MFFSESGVCKINVDLKNVQFQVHGPPLPITMLNREHLPRDLRRIHVYFAAPCTHSFEFYFQHCDGGNGGWAVMRIVKPTFILQTPDSEKKHIRCVFLVLFGPHRLIPSLGHPIFYCKPWFPCVPNLSKQDGLLAT